MKALKSELHAKAEVRVSPHSPESGPYWRNYLALRKEVSVRDGGLVHTTGFTVGLTSPAQLSLPSLKLPQTPPALMYTRGGNGPSLTEAVRECAS